MRFHRRDVAAFRRTLAIRWSIAVAVALLTSHPGLPMAAAAGLDGPGSVAAASDEPGLIERLESIRGGLDEIERSLSHGDREGARALALRLYLDQFETIEGWWGPGGPHATPALASRVREAEAAFHALIQADGAALPAAAARLRHALAPIEQEARKPGVVLRPEAPSGTVSRDVAGGTVSADAAAGTAGVSRDATAPADPPEMRSAEIAALAAELERARTAYAAGDRDAALAAVEHGYLEGFEPLESRLPSDLVGRIERAIHLSLRPSIRAGDPEAEVDAMFATLYTDLALADSQLSGGASFWFGAVNAFAIIFREGLEAVLLIGAILAYMSRTAEGARHRRQVWLGVAGGIAASVATWVLAVTLVPVSGASREMVEGVTALVAVGVLLYVSHWLFQKTYIHDWKAYLQEHVGRAMTRGSALAMAGLAFAAVYREGFETVLFYQALMFDAGPAAVLAGFTPGILVILAIGYGIVRLGLKLPLKRVFGVTGSVLLYLAFVFIGKGLYNLQEAGVFAPHPLTWAPDHEALRQILGLYPVAETILAQAAFLMLLGAGAFWYRTRNARAAAPLRQALPTTANAPGPRVAEAAASVASRPQMEPAETR
ncbi:MAG TPA: FTR1 family protein [Gemmatimonadota bacterium]|nr:FTR1 family protein [Gemmatimonadota bacterium]